MGSGGRSLTSSLSSFPRETSTGGVPYTSCTNSAPLFYTTRLETLRDLLGLKHRETSRVLSDIQEERDNTRTAKGSLYRGRFRKGHSPPLENKRPFIPLRLILVTGHSPPSASRKALPPKVVPIHSRRL